MTNRPAHFGTYTYHLAIAANLLCMGDLDLSGPRAKFLACVALGLDAATAADLGVNVEIDATNPWAVWAVSWNYLVVTGRTARLAPMFDVALEKIRVDIEVFDAIAAAEAA